MNFIDVIVPLPLKNSFTYLVNQQEFNFLDIGYRVVVPFGKSKFVTGIVSKKHKNSPKKYLPKEIEFIIDNSPIITKNQLIFFKWISDYYLCPIGQVIKVALPKLLLLKSESEIFLNDKNFQEEYFSKNAKKIIQFLELKKKISLKDLSSLLGKKNINSEISELLDQSIISVKEEIYDYFKPKKITSLYLNDRIEVQKSLDVLKLKKSQLKIFKFILNEKSKNFFTYSYLIEKCKVSRQTINNLIESKILIKNEEIINRTQFSVEKLIQPKDLSLEQENALNQIISSFDEKDVTLFHGVTSSGKTEIYVKLIMDYLKNNKQVLYLVPEIALTTQLVLRLKKYFGDKLLVYHSKYTLDQRIETWNIVLNNPGKIILGARSSIFLPFNDLKLIIVDEEHENAYKQFNPSPRYHARDSSIYLAKLHNAKVLLGSATPSLESYFNAVSNKYNLVNLFKRYNDIDLPSIVLKDLKESTALNKMVGSFSKYLIDEIRTVLKNGKQVIIFQNRRGYSPYQECASCGYVFNCKNCDVSLTYHQITNELKCHHCGYCIINESKCIKCNSYSLIKKGLGTQQVVEELRNLFPQFRTERMDQDSTKNKNSFFKLMNEFEYQEFQILVGTQMLVKGLDFKNVSLVGVVNADNLIYFPDFRSQEKCFQLIQQVAGRAGRSISGGKVIVQTYNPNHNVMLKIKNNDFRGLFNDQLKERHIFNYPPYSRIIKITLKNKNLNNLKSSALWISKSLKSYFKDRVFGPEFPLIPRLQNHYINIFQIKIPVDFNLKESKMVIEKISNSFDSIPQFRSTKFLIDVDPYN